MRRALARNLPGQKERTCSQMSMGILEITMRPLRSLVGPLALGVVGGSQPLGRPPIFRLLLGDMAGSSTAVVMSRSGSAEWGRFLVDGEPGIVTGSLIGSSTR